MADFHQRFPLFLISPPQVCLSAHCSRLTAADHLVACTYCVHLPLLQLYLRFPDVAGEPPLQLKGFAKVKLEPGAKQTVTFPLNARSVSIWDVSTHAWSVVSGQFSVMVGTSSESIQAKGSFTV